MAATLLIAILGFSRGPADASTIDNTTGDCTVYATDDSYGLANCESGCGACWNPGSRSGAMCSGITSSGTVGSGYYCPEDVYSNKSNLGTGFHHRRERNPLAVDFEVNIAYACMDWSFGSNAMQQAEAAFTQRTDDNVYFGVGTYGSTDDPQRGLGACYRMSVDGVDRDIIAQSINTGSDVDGLQFDLQMGAGGAGLFNMCAGGDHPDATMFGGSVDPWGCVYGGVDNATACAGLPTYPQHSEAMETAGDSLPELCEYSFSKNVRLSGAGLPAGICMYSPTLLDVARVACPEELVDLTWFQRSDEPSSSSSSSSSLSSPSSPYAFTANTKRPAGFPNKKWVPDSGASGGNGKGGGRWVAENECQSDVPDAGLAYCLTRMMDCRKPSGAYKDNIDESLMVPGRLLVQTCAADGYSRIDVQCGCANCYC